LSADAMNCCCSEPRRRYSSRRWCSAALVRRSVKLAEARRWCRRWSPGSPPAARERERDCTVFTVPPLLVTVVETGRSGCLRRMCRSILRPSWSSPIALGPGSFVPTRTRQPSVGDYNMATGRCAQSTDPTLTSRNGIACPCQPVDARRSAFHIASQRCSAHLHG